MKKAGEMKEYRRGELIPKDSFGKESDLLEDLRAAFGEEPAPGRTPGFCRRAHQQGPRPEREPGRCSNGRVSGSTRLSGLSSWR